MEQVRGVSRLAGLDLTKQENMLLFVCTESSKSKPVKQETSCTVIVSALWIGTLDTFKLIVREPVNQSGQSFHDSRDRNEVAIVCLVK